MVAGYDNYVSGDFLGLVHRLVNLGIWLSAGHFWQMAIL